jgi:hypothetical protein
VTSHVAKKLWKCKVPLKVKIFLWQAMQNRIQTSQQLKSKKWKGRDACTVCGASEDADHLLFLCPMAKFAWAFLSEALGAEWLPQLHAGPANCLVA